MITKPIGLYLHTPFCVRKCNYCDFCSFPEESISPEQRAEYIDTLVAEITSYKREPKIDVDTVFFGGGTPSLLEPSELEKIFAAIREAFEITPDAEITIEEIEEKFGKRVRELVASETEDKRAELPPSETWRVRKEESLATLKNTDDIGVLMVWLGDKLANMRSIYRDFKEEGNAMWQRFNQKDPEQQAWYYKSIIALTEPLSDTSAWLEYKTLTELVFGKGE